MRVVYRAPQAEPDLSHGQLLGNRPGVGQRACQPVELGDHQGVALAASGQRLSQPRTFSVGACQPVVT